VKAVVLTGTGGYDVLQVQERPDPPVGPGEVRIAVKAAGINFADTMARVGLYPDAPKPPCVLGYEVAGEVETVGEGVSEFQVGDRVVGGTRFGGQAELVTVPEAQAFALPPGLNFEQGAAIPVNYGTAYAALILMGSLRKGDRVLIHAAAGGVGISATQIARNAGAEIFGTASPSKHEAIRAQGVDRLPRTGLRGRDDADHRWRGGRLGHRRARPHVFPQGLPPAPIRRTDGHVRTLRGHHGRQAKHRRDAEEPGLDAERDDAMVEEPADHE
jgi:NADPH:quinone reductase-like Zn-dependent oxidoreductase